MAIFIPFRQPLPTIRQPLIYENAGTISRLLGAIPTFAGVDARAPRAQVEDGGRWEWPHGWAPMLRDGGRDKI